jgi:hypothetical protein
MLYSFDAVILSHDTFTLFLLNHYITNFIGLTVLPYLTRLELDGNPIQSFKGCLVLPRLRKLSLRYTPISRSLHFKLMAIIAFGSELVEINYEPVPAQSRTLADTLRPNLHRHLRAGKIISTLKPLRTVTPTENQIDRPDPNLVGAAIEVGYTSPHQIRTTEVLSSTYESPPPRLAAICDDFLRHRKAVLKRRGRHAILRKVDALRLRFNGTPFREWPDESSDYSEDDDEAERSPTRRSDRKADANNSDFRAANASNPGESCPERSGEHFGIEGDLALLSKESSPDGSREPSSLELAAVDCPVAIEGTVLPHESPAIEPIVDQNGHAPEDAEGDGTLMICGSAPEVEVLSNI